MPCCTLTAFLLSQLGIAAGAVKVRLFGGANFGALAPGFLRELLGRWRWSGIAAALCIELVLGGAAAPYIFTQQGRTDAARSFVGAWHICSIGAGIAARAVHLASR